MKKRIISIFSAIAIMFNLAAVFPINAYASDGSVRVYEYDGYAVEYTVVSGNASAQNVAVVLRNTGRETIFNWALRLNAGGQISNIQNAVRLDRSGNEYIIRNNGRNGEIKPGESVRFTYRVAVGNRYFPAGVELCSKKVDMTKDVTVRLNVAQDRGEDFRATVSIRNNSRVNIEVWELAFNSNFKITSTSNGRIIRENSNGYVIGGVSLNTVIRPGATLNIGIVGSKLPGITARIGNHSLTAVNIVNELPRVINGGGSGGGNA